MIGICQNILDFVRNLPINHTDFHNGSPRESAVNEKLGLFHRFDAQQNDVFPIGKAVRRQ